MSITLQTIIPILYDSNEGGVNPKILLAVYIFLTLISLVGYVYKILNWILKREEWFYRSIFHYIYEDCNILNSYTIAVQFSAFSFFMILIIYRLL